MKPTMLSAVFLLFAAPSLFAQGSPLHGGYYSSNSVIPDRSDHPTGSAEKQAALESVGSHSSNYQSPGSGSGGYNYVANPPSPDRTTRAEINALASKFRKMREAREAKARDAAQQKKP